MSRNRCLFVLSLALAVAGYALPVMAAARLTASSAAAIQHSATITRRLLQHVMRSPSLV